MAENRSNAVIALFFTLLLSLPLSAGRTFGGASTDRIEFTQYAAINDLDTLTYALWTYRTGDGGNNNGRMIDKRNANANGGSFLYTTSSTYAFEAHRWQTSDGAWSVTRPAGNTCVHVAVTYDHGSVSNDPIFYFDGVDQGAPTEITTPSGTLASETETLVIGNRTAGNRSWDGRLASVAIWNVILTVGEIEALAKGTSPASIRPLNLVFHPPLWGVASPEPNLVAGGNNGTVTGAVLADHCPSGPYR